MTCSSLQKGSVFCSCQRGIFWKWKKQDSPSTGMSFWWWSSSGVCSECPPCGTNPVYACPGSHCTSEGFDDHLLLSLHVGTGIPSAVKVFSLVWALKRNSDILPKVSSKHLRESLAAAQLQSKLQLSELLGVLY